MNYTGGKDMELILPEIYKQFEGTELWNAVSQCLDDLVENQDIYLTTQKEYVVGYICKRFNEIDVL